METINFGIDLGTTNSLIARFVKGQVEIFKNPNGFKDSLPSVVAYRKDRMIVGEKAREYQEKDPANVVGRFKRKMGTAEGFKIKSLGQIRTPIDLSAEVLKELKGFVHTGQTVDAAVITIPASFDTIQCNATKQAAEQAGFKQVVLLQEPIAASLAYANKRKEKEMPEGKWLVYDLGGGTFDVALVRTEHGELKILDHEGDNFLGGVDFDSSIVEGIIIPKLEQTGTFADLANQMKSQDGKYNNLWVKCLHKAEEAKIEMSSKLSSEIEIEITDDLDDQHDIVITVTRSDFENLIKASIDRTADMIKAILTRNNLSSKDLNFVLMVGGSTLVPLVRQRVGELLNIPVVTDIDPTTAIVVGAAYFAGTQPIQTKITSDNAAAAKAKFNIKAVYERQTRDVEIPFSAKVEGEFHGLNYRIVRADGGFDSGNKPLTGRIFEDLPLEQDAYNTFEFRTTDAAGNQIPNNLAEIQVAHGKYSVAGQTLPQDICIETDSTDEDGSTSLSRIFSRNSLLPAKYKRTVTVSRTLIRGSSDAIRIIVREGPADAGPESAKEIGTLLIAGTQITRDIPKGTEIDLAFDMDQSRIIRVEAYVNATSQDFAEVFNPKQRSVDISNLGHHLSLLQQRLDHELDEATENDQYETAKELKRLESAILDVGDKAARLSATDVTDDRYKLEDRKRDLAQQIDRLTGDKRIVKARKEYEEMCARCERLVSKHGNDRDRFKLDQIKAQEHSFLKATNPKSIQQRIDELNDINIGILIKLPEFLIGQFEWLSGQRSRLNDQAQASLLIDSGNRAIQQQDFDKLRMINGQLIDLLPEENREEARAFTGIQ
ncbi:MAG: Hsp70 family protein [Verrucomicrobiaceae bacterium]